MGKKGKAEGKLKTPWGDLNDPKPGEYKNLSDFITRNSLREVFKKAISGDREIEEYCDVYEGEYGSEDLTQRVIGDISNWKWNDRITFKPSGKAFTFE